MGHITNKVKKKKKILLHYLLLSSFIYLYHACVYTSDTHLLVKTSNNENVLVDSI